MSRPLIILASLLLAQPVLHAAASVDPPTSVIFIHPDGAGLAHWGLARVRWAGPDGFLAWDRLPAMALYRPHVRDCLAPASHSGATIHAYGVKVPQDSFGLDGAEVPLTPAGERASLMQRAIREGRGAGIVNSGSLSEPGTACFLASVPSRSMDEEIARQLLDSGAQVILGGGEELFLPKGAKGRHGEGLREDRRDLVAEARARGYRVVFTREELLATPAETPRLLGLFAREDTYHDASEEALREKSRVPYPDGAPSVAEMEQVALAILSRNPKGFLLMVEEEGSDNFSNARNAAGMLLAMRRADEAIAVAEAFRAEHPRTLVLVAADSDASAPQLVAVVPSAGLIVAGRPLAETATRMGVSLDGVDGTGTVPFESAPDARGERHAFAVAWASDGDGGDPVVVRAAGPGSEEVQGLLDNTDLYRIMFRALFGMRPEDARAAATAAP